MSDPVDLARLRELHEAATQEPWDYLWAENSRGAGQAVESMGMAAGYGLFREGATLWPADDPNAIGVVGPTSFTTADAEWIAAAHNAFPSLLDAAEENGRLREALRDVLDAPPRPYLAQRRWEADGNATDAEVLDRWTANRKEVFASARAVLAPRTGTEETT